MLRRVIKLYKMNNENILFLLKRYQYIAIAAIATLTITLISVGIISTHVSAQRTSERVKVVKSIKIQKGDTLWKIAKEHITDEYSNITAYIKEIKESNGLLSDTIHEDRYLIVPHYVTSNAN